MDESRAIEDLQAILARPEFEVRPTPSFFDWLGSLVLGFLYDLYVLLFRAIGEAASGREGPIGIFVLVLLLLAVAALSVFLVQAARVSIVGEARAATTRAAARRERSDRLWQEAQDLAEAGQWGEAIRSLYLSALFALDEHALLHVNESWTNREHATRLAGQSPALGRVFLAVVERYDRLRYRHDPADATAFQDLSRLVDQTRSATA